MKPHWVAIAPSRRIRNHPRRITIDEHPLVLFRDANGLHCLDDRCPHRHAPLSGGKVQADGLECPYHGWRFDGSGRCVAVPGLCGPLPNLVVPRHRVAEVGGVVFLAIGHPHHQPRTSALDDADHVRIIVESDVPAPLIDAAENILDATHTHFTHRGLLRGLSARRNRVAVTVVAAGDAVEATYVGEPRQDGLVSRLLEGGRTTSIGRFRFPGVAELEFRGPRGPNLVTTFHLREEAPGRTHGIAVLAGPRQGGLGWIKAALFLPLFKLALLQDRRILSAVSANGAAFGACAPAMGPLDILRRDIAALLRGDDLSREERSLLMEL